MEDKLDVKCLKSIYPLRQIIEIKMTKNGKRVGLRSASFTLGLHLKNMYTIRAQYNTAVLYTCYTAFITYFNYTSNYITI